MQELHTTLDGWDLNFSRILNDHEVDDVYRLLSLLPEINPENGDDLRKWRFGDTFFVGGFTRHWNTIV